MVTLAKVIGPFFLQLLADGVIPNEYGINPKQKLKIGSKVSFSFLFFPLFIPRFFNRSVEDKSKAEIAID